MTIGIGGSSRSGKTSLAVLICQLLTVGEGNSHSMGKGGKTATILAQDDFVFPDEQIPKIQQGKEIEINWEIPKSIDFQKYKNAILDAQQQFDYVITEGLLNYYDDDINLLFDICFFVEISKPTFLKRKAADKRWGAVPDWYIEHIWDSYERWGRTILADKKKEVLVLSGEVPFDVEVVLDFLKK